MDRMGRIGVGFRVSWGRWQWKYEAKQWNKQPIQILQRIFHQTKEYRFHFIGKYFLIGSVEPEEKKISFPINQEVGKKYGENGKSTKRD